MSAPTSLTGELLDLVAQTQATMRRAYDELLAANERGPVGADLEAFSAAMRERDRAESEIKARWFPRAGRVGVSGIHDRPTLVVWSPKGRRGRLIEAA